MADRDQFLRQTRSRIEELRQRTLEIEQRNLELARRETARGSSIRDVQRAQERADHAQAHVAAARACALQSLLRSAAAHEAAAERYEQLAAVGFGDAESHLTRPPSIARCQQRTAGWPCSSADAGQRVGMATCDGPVIVVAASAGGFHPLRALISGLPADLPAAVLVVLHIPPRGGSSLPSILDRAGPLSAAAAVDGEPIQPGRVYVAPPNRHLLVIKDTVRLSRGPRQNGVRPAADPLFRSAALHAGPQVTAVVLSGALDDGALGSATVERMGGRVVVQDPDEAEYDSMPRSAIAVTGHAAVTPTKALSDEVTRLVTGEGGMAAEVPEPDRELVAEIAGLLGGAPEPDPHLRTYSHLTGPDCGGPLYFKNAAELDRAETYDCLVGHRWSPDSLFEEQGTAVERALWLAIRSLEERGRLTGKLADTARERGYALSAGQFSEAAKEARQSADVIREVVNSMRAEVATAPDGA